MVLGERDPTATGTLPAAGHFTGDTAAKLHARNLDGRPGRRLRDHQVRDHHRRYGARALYLPVLAEVLRARGDAGEREGVNSDLPGSRDKSPKR